MLRTGVDIIEIERVRAAIDAHGERFLRRVYTEAELACCGDRVESLAARFAAKEAVAKALAAEQGLVTWSLSLSHHRTQAVAFVIAMGET
jgi:holo-[acyl-carrier protein] synthase